MVTVKKGNNCFYVGDSEARPQAILTYVSKDSHTVIAEHTFVSDELRGQHIAQLLLKQLVDWARTEHKKIVPVCSFVQSEIQRKKEYSDILAK